MADRLVTIATFDAPTQAQIARGALEDAGIDAVLTDENTVTLFWSLSNAVGGIKVQVREADAERAVAVIEEALGPDEVVDPEELATEAEAAVREDETELPDDRHAPANTATTDGAFAPAPGSREDYARRLFFAAWLTMVVPPLPFYALYLFLNAAFGEGELSPRGRLNLFVGAFPTTIGLAFCFLAPRLFCFQ